MVEGLWLRVPFHSTAGVGGSWWEQMAWTRFGQHLRGGKRIGSGPGIHESGLYPPPLSSSGKLARAKLACLGPEKKGDKVRVLVTRHW